jgi:hypothetical protein
MMELKINPPTTKAPPLPPHQQGLGESTGWLWRREIPQVVCAAAAGRKKGQAAFGRAKTTGKNMEPFGLFSPDSGILFGIKKLEREEVRALT